MKTLIWFALVAFSILPVGTWAAGEMQFGSWMSGTATNGTGVYAGTTNDSGDVFAEYCDYASKTCRWALLTTTGCEKDHAYPALGNTDKGAASLELVCDGAVDDKYRYFFNNWKELEALIKTSARFGLAVPMQADQFQVH
jgi:hypothetical protein